MYECQTHVSTALAAMSTCLGSLENKHGHAVAGILPPTLLETGRETVPRLISRRFVADGKGLRSEYFVVYSTRGE